MTGDIQQIEKESFWKEHQDSLLKIRKDLLSGKRRRPSPLIGVRKKTPNGIPEHRASSHPLLGKYRRSPLPFLPKLTPEPEKKILMKDGAYKNKYNVVPPLKPRKAFEDNVSPKKPKKFFDESLPTRKLHRIVDENIPPIKLKKAFESKVVDDYDSWGEESDEEDDYIDMDSSEEETADVVKQPRRRAKKPQMRSSRKVKPQPYPSIQQPYFPPPIVYGAPFPVYYPPPPVGARRGKRQREKHLEKRPKFKEPAHKHSSVRKKKKASNPVFAASYPMMPGVTMMYQHPEEFEEEEETEVDEMVQDALNHWKSHPLFASDFCDSFIQDCLNTDIIPDLLIDTLNEIKHMPYNHPLYLPSLYTCEDLLSDQVSAMATDIAREAVAELANDYLDEKLLKRDPLEDFFSDLVEDVVRQGAREAVGSTVIDMAEDHMRTENATALMNDLIADWVEELAPGLLEEVKFDIIAEEFILSEVIAPEVKEEAEVVAKESIQYYDDKVIRRQLKEVNTLARDKLADAVILDYLMSLMFQHGKLWAETDHQNKFLDDMIFNTGLAQIFSIHKNREKTVKCKPLQKLHEKVVSDVALDVFLQHLTRTLDEDLADVDEYERGVTDESSHPFPLVAR